MVVNAGAMAVSSVATEYRIVPAWGSTPAGLEVTVTGAAVSPATFTVTAKTAVVDHQGGTFMYSGATDYNAMAAALKTMHLFKGSFTG